VTETDGNSIDPDAELRDDPRLEEATHDDLVEGEIEVISGEWIRGSKRPE
jgi:hypothetical protein